MSLKPNLMDNRNVILLYIYKISIFLNFKDQSENLWKYSKVRDYAKTFE